MTVHSTYVQIVGAGGFFASCTVCGSDPFPNRASLAQAESDARAHGELREIYPREDLEAHDRRYAPAQGGVEVRGVVAKNGRGELCFFAHSRATGIPFSNLYAVDEAVHAAPGRRATHEQLATLDPAELGGETVELETAQ